MIFSKRLFLVAGIYGLLVLPPQYFLEAKLGRDYPPPITHPEHYYGFLGVALAWQLLFLVIARDPGKYRLAMVPAAVEKFGFGFAAVILFLNQRVAPVVMAAGAVDLVLGVLFLVAFRRVASARA
jgi:hypothetical protein